VRQELTPALRRRRRLVPLVLGVCLAATAIIVFVQTQREPVTVMTRNVYLGADITRPVRAVQGLTGEKALLALGHANQEVSLILTRTDFRTRSRLLAAEIENAAPDLVGLQEVARWRHGPLELDRLGELDATEVDQDFLALLLSDLKDRGVGYDVVHEQPESDVEAPAFSGNPLTGTAASARDVRLTVSDVILLRRGSQARVTASGGAQYAERLVLDLAGAPFSFTRGFAWADVEVGAAKFRFVTTHLESQGADVAKTQAEELLASPILAIDRAVVLVCDCNSDPADTRVQPGDSVPGSAAYSALTGAGFEDQWLRQEAPGPGFTSGFGELVDDTTAEGLAQRLDLVLARPGEGSVGFTEARVTGAALTDRDPPTGLWPSDHAGVVAELRIR